LEKSSKGSKKALKRLEDM
jgi:hypothetical protein